MRHLKFRIVGSFDGFADVIVNAVFLPGSQTLNIHREPVNGYTLETWTDFAREHDFPAWTDRNVMDLLGRLYGAFQPIPVHNNGSSPLPVL